MTSIVLPTLCAALHGECLELMEANIPKYIQQRSGRVQSSTASLDMDRVIIMALHRDKQAVLHGRWDIAVVF